MGYFQMPRGLDRCRALAAGLAAAALLVGAAGPAAATPDLTAWNQIWDKVGGWHFDPSIPNRPGFWDHPPYTPEYQALADKITSSEMAGKPMNDQGAQCQTRGVVQMMLNVYPLESIATPKQVTFIHEYLREVRRIYTDGRPMPEDPNPSRFGYSIGHWEGNVLVVDTAGLSDDLTFTHGLPLGPDLHVHERMYFQDANTFVNEMTLTSKAFTKPYYMKRTYHRSKFEMLDYSCENNRNPTSDDGHTGVVLESGGKGTTVFVK